MDAVVVKALYKSFDQRYVLRDIEFHVQPGEVLALIGQTGSGKTTLGRVIAGLETFDRGEIAVLGHSLRPGRLPKKKSFYRQVQYLFQHAASSFNPDFTCAEVVMEPMRVQNLFPGKQKQRAWELIDMVGLNGLADQPARAISGGQAQRLALARALAMGPKLLIADEITAGLDREMKQEIVKILLDLVHNQSLTLILITHELGIVRAVAENCAVLLDGLIMEAGPCEALLNTPAHPYTRLLVESEITQEEPDRPVPPYEPMTAPDGACPFHPNCPIRTKDCLSLPLLRQKDRDRFVRCVW